MNLNRSEYTLSRTHVASELAIVTAASIAHMLSEKRQTVGLTSNGHDPLAENRQHIILPPKSGRDNLIHLLDALARVQLSDDNPFSDLLQQARLQLTWGGTGVIITPDADDSLFERLLIMKQSGFHVILIVVDPHSAFDLIRDRAKAVGIRSYEVWEERDLDVWRI